MGQVISVVLVGTDKVPRRPFGLGMTIDRPFGLGMTIDRPFGLGMTIDRPFGLGMTKSFEQLMINLYLMLRYANYRNFQPKVFSCL
jgi:hypothetical protein